MSTPRPVLTETLLRDALSGRAEGPQTAADLLDDVLTAVATLPQGRSWSPPHVASWRLLPVPLVVLSLAALIGAVLVAGGRNTTPVAGADEIAFVQPTYTCGDEPCVYLPTADVMAGLRVSRTRILSVAGDGGEPAPLIDVPGESRPIPGASGWSISDPRSGWLAGPAVRWSPDGRRLAFRLFNDVPGIYLMDRNGSGLTRLVDLPNDALSGMPFSAAFAWSPDGTRIAFTYPYGGFQSPLYIVDTSDGRVTGLGVQATRAVAWSPDGSRIAFARTQAPEDNQGAELFVVNADGSGETRLFAADPPGYLIGAIAWSPDGSKIAFDIAAGGRAEGQDKQSGLYTIKPDGKELRMLTEPVGVIDPGGGCCFFVSLGLPLEWSPDGSRIAASVDGGIGLANADGSGVRRIGPPFASSFDWSPDGSRLVYATGPAWASGWGSRQEVSTEDWSSIYVVNADGTGNRWLADGEYPDWSPSSSP